MGPTPRTRAFVRWTLRHGRILWIVALVLAVPALARTAWLYAHLRSDLEELLPPDAPSVVALREMRTRMPGLQYLGVLVESSDLPAAERLLDALAARVRTYPAELQRSVRTGVTEERAFYERHAPLYAEVDDLRTIRDRVQARREWETKKAFGADLDDEGDGPPPSVDLSDLEKKYAKDELSAGRFPDGRFTDARLHVTLLLIEVGTYSTGSESAHALLDRVKADLKTLDPHAYARDARIGFTGDVAISVEELSALVSDLTVSSVLVLLAVGAVILLFYRWWRSLVALVVPLLIATVFAFALVTLPPFRITELNSNTAFLGSIIVGNGINFGIILLARYVEERRKGVEVEEAIAIGVWGSRVGTLSAALAAGLSYLSLVITSFRGFRQFGVIGGIGMLLCWSAAYLLTPSMLRWLDRGGASAPKPRTFGAGLMPGLSRAVERHALPIVLGALVVTALAGWNLRKLNHDAIETDFGKLRRADTWVSGEGYWGKKMDALLGRYLTPLVILSDDPEQARKSETAVRAATDREPLVGLIDSVVGVDDVLPRAQDEKIALTEEIRGMLTPKLRAQIPPERRKQLDAILGPGDLKPLRAEDLPPTFTVGMREKDGRLDRTTLVYPRPSDAMWQGDKIIAVTDTLRSLARGVAPTHAGRVAGSIPLSGDILSSIEHDGPLATSAAMAGVVILVVLLLRGSASTIAVIGSLFLGVVWLTGFILALHVKINFANFIAFPITFGIGVDYSVNVMARYVADHQGRPERLGDITAAVASTGGAVGLCSMTTIIGYSSLLLAENQALFSFGLVAVLGELACLTTAVIVLPAAVVVLQRLRRVRASRASSID